MLNGSCAGAVFLLPDVPTVLGRSPEAHLRLDDPWISSMHALFERRGGEVWVVDLESRNGTFIGDDRITEAPVTPGTLLRFGRTEVRVEAGTTAARDPSQAARAPDRETERARADGQRATIRAVARDGGSRVAEEEAPARAEDGPLDACRATLLRVALHLAPAERTPGAGAVRAALDAVQRAALDEGGIAVRLGGTGVLALFGMTGPAPDDALRAVRAVRSARAAVRALHEALDLRAAVDAGRVVAGNVGPPEAFALAALGADAERCERILALAGAGEILLGPGAAGPIPGRLEVARVGGDEIAILRAD